MKKQRAPYPWLRERWRHFWFEPVSPFNLGACRVLFFGALFLFYLPRDLAAWADVPGVFWQPITLFRVLHLSVLSASALAAISNIWKAALGLSCVGLYTRLSTWIAFILGVYLLGLPQNFGTTSHMEAILVFVLGIMALSRCGDSLSLDAVRRSARHPGYGHPPPSGEYTWPVRMVWLIMALIFFAAGLAKLKTSGLEWFTSDSLAIILTQSHYHHSGTDPLTNWGLHIAQIGWLCRLLALTTVLIEVLFPLALVSRHARWILVPGTFLMQSGIRLLMGPAFEQFMVCYLFWIPWDRVADRIAARQPQLAPAFSHQHHLPTEIPRCP